MNFRGIRPIIEYTYLHIICGHSVIPVANFLRNITDLGHQYEWAIGHERKGSYCKVSKSIRDLNATLRNEMTQRKEALVNCIDSFLFFE